MIHPKRPFPRGFTLIELMIVVAIIGLLAVIAIPKFGDMVIKAKESNAKNALGALRSAVSIYYSDNTFYPIDLEVALTTEAKYYDHIPVIDIPPVPAQGNPGHQRVSGVNYISSPNDDTTTGVWAYIAVGDQGLVYINCTHLDGKGFPWTSY